MGAPALAELPRLRPHPWPVTPYGAFRLVTQADIDEDAEPRRKLIRFPTKGHRVIAWIEANCVFTQRRWARKPFRLEQWQKQLIIDLFETGADGLRRFRWALIGMPRKNGKTELLAALALYFLLGDESDDVPCIVMAATSDEQANLMFSATSRMAAYSPTISRTVQIFGDEIQVTGQPEAKIVRVSSKARTKHGLNISILICDELHEWPPGSGDELWEVLTTAMSTGEEPFVLQITTAGFDLDGTLCGRQYQYCRQIESGELDDDAYFFRWWQAPDGCDHRDPAMWQWANPAYGTFKNPAYFRDRLTKIRESMFRRLELNQWTETEETWLPSGAWDACKLPPLPNADAEAVLVFTRALLATTPEDQQDAIKFTIRVIEDALRAGLVPGVDTFVGWDAASKYDSTALVAVQESGDRVRVKAWVWERPYDPKKNQLLENWLMPIDEVVATILALHRVFRVRATPFDPALISWEAGKLLALGVAMLEFPQATRRMEEASQALYEAVTSQRLAHDGDPVLARHIANAVAKHARTGAAAWRLTKGGDTSRKMDAAVALAMAIWCLQHPPEEEKKKAPPTIYLGADDDD